MNVTIPRVRRMMSSFRWQAIVLRQRRYQPGPGPIRGETAAPRGEVSCGPDGLSSLSARRVRQAGLTRLALLGLIIGSTMINVYAQAPGTNRVAAIFQNQLTLVESDVVSLAEAMPAEQRRGDSRW